MYKKIMIVGGITAVLALGTSCSSHYVMTGISRNRILVDKTYDAAPDAGAMAFLAPYKQKVDSLMSPVVGTSAAYMAAHRPESELSNLLTDIIVWGSKKFDEHPDFGVYNMGGIRAALPKGNITYGDVLEVAPFENKICFLTLTGDKVLELFRQMALRGGEGVSHSVRLKISSDGNLLSAQINGKPVKKDAKYRIATLDYVAQGNDEMEAFKAKTDVVQPQSSENNVCFIIMDYLREKAAQGQSVSAKTEGRIVVE